jgi:3-phenylpropionate/trans-cinnamate dioxygenase ferredoxin reductase component
MRMKSAGFVIVGAGQSAAVAARTLRESGYGGRITMVGRERHKPYERPPLSKAVLVAAQEPPLAVVAEEFWTRSYVDLLSNSDVIALDVANQAVRLANGHAIEYEKCLLATGGEARTLAGFPRSNGRVHYLRTLDDARRLRAALQHRPTVGILGGGFLGLEIAHSALAAGASVSVIERAASLLDRFVPPDVSRWIESELRHAGAQVLLGTSISAVQPLPGDRMLLATDAGTQLEVDEVVVAVGLSPNDTLGREAGLKVGPDGGVWVDANCRTSNENVFASGDCASQQRAGQARPMRLESWQNANEQARTAAAAMLGARPMPPSVPWFWTDQGSHNIQMLGLPAGDLEYVRRGDPANAKALWIGHRHFVPVHGVAINAGAELRAVRPLFEQAQPVQLQNFHLATLDLRAWAKQTLADAAVSV